MRTLIVAMGLVAVAGCAHVKYIPGTKIPDTKRNRAIIAVVEKYRHAMIRKDAATLMAMAHPNYYEHSGTPKGEDDYGYKGLLRVIKKRLAQLETVRYELKYRKIHWLSPTKVEVEVYVDASFQLRLPSGESRWSRFADYNKFVLAKYKGRWLFLRGM